MHSRALPNWTLTSCARLQMTHTLFAPLHPGQLPTASAYGDAVEFLAGPKSLHITGINLPLDQVCVMT